MKQTSYEIIKYLKSALSEVIFQFIMTSTGVKTFKKDLLASLERRMGDFETMEHFSLATALDPR